MVCNYTQEPGCPKVFMPLENVKSNTEGDCSDATKVKHYFGWRWNDELGMVQPMVMGTQEVVPAMHFQGPECKQTLSDIACANINSCGALANLRLAALACPLGADACSR